MKPLTPEVAELHTALDRALEEGLRPLGDPTEPTGLLFSGGVDSTLLAWELRARPGLSLWTVGREGSADLRAGRTAAEELGLPWHPILATQRGVLDSEARFRSELDGTSPVGRAVLLSLALAFQGSEPRTLLCGQGADELFLGYAHFRGLSEREADLRSRDDLERALHVDWPRTERIARALDKTVLAPYLSPAFIAAAHRVPVDLRLPRELPKRFFREWAIRRGLPPGLAARPKKAMQYGSGVDALLRRSRNR